MDYRRLTRPWRRLFKPFLSRADKDAIAGAIAHAEKDTSGEIHAHVIGSFDGLEPLDVARAAFARLGLSKTRARNGVIVVVAHLDHRFAIWGDEGIHAKAGQELWDLAAAALEAGLKAGKPADGLAACVAEIGKALARHFPPGPDDNPNELPDDVTEG